MSSERVTLTHPEIPDSAYSVFDFQVDLYKARGWKVADSGQPESTTNPAPAKKASKPAAAPSDTPKES